jgi:hypothetical protein
MPERKSRSTIDALLTSPIAADPKIRAAVSEYVRGTIAELGGHRNISAAQRATVLGQKIALTIVLVGEAQLAAQDSLLDEDRQPLGILKTLETYIALFRKGQVALGLTKLRRPQTPALTLQDVIKEYRASWNL